MTNPANPTRDELRAREEAVRAKREKRERGDEDKARLRRLEIDELVEELTDKHGTRGEDFDVIDAGKLGVLALKRGEAVTYKKYRSLILRDKYTITLEDNVAFVRPCVIAPDAAKFDEMVGAAPGILDVAARILLRLYGVQSEADAGKR